MADLSAVEIALGNLVVEICYPNGVPLGALPVSTVIGAPITVERGWPDAEELAVLLKQGIVTVYINAEKGMSVDKSRWLKNEWKTLSIPVSTITTTTNGNLLTFSGVIGAPHLVGVQVGTLPPSVISVDIPATLTDVAAGIQSLVPGSVLRGTNSVLMPAAFTVRTTGFGVLYQDVRRQEQVFRITVFSADALTRDKALSAVDVALANLDWMPLPDGLHGRLLYRDSPEGDETTKVGVWRRDLRYSVEYSTIVTQSAPNVLWASYDVAISVGNTPTRSVTS